MSQLFSDINSLAVIGVTSSVAAIAAFALTQVITKNKKEKNNLQKEIDKLTNENNNLEKILSKESLENNDKQQILNKITYPIWQRDENLEIIFFNEFYSKIIDIAPNDYENTASKELHKTSKLFAEKVKETKLPQIERKHVISSGDRRLFQITEVPLSDGGTVGFARDITELEEAKNEMKLHVAVQENLLESSASAVAIYSADRHLQYYNNAFINLWKLDESFLSNKPLYSEILEELREKRRLPEQANFLEFKKRNMAMFTTITDKYEEIYHLPSGKTLRMVAIPHENGGLLFSYEDLTDQLQLERTYNTIISVNKYTMENLSEAVAVFHEDGKLQLWNPVFADMWQVSSDFLKEKPHLSEILEKTQFLYEFGEDWDLFKQTILSIFNKRHSENQKLERTDGSILEWHTAPLPDGNMLMTYNDITASMNVQKSLRAEKKALEEAHNIKASFLENVSYELRSPLTSIKGFSEVLMKKYFGELNEKQEEYTKGIFDSAEKLNLFITNILDISSIDAGYMTLEIEEFDIYNAIANVVTDIKTSIESPTPNIIFKCPPKIGRMSGDEERIKQIITNIIRNSIKFVDKETGEIIVKISIKRGGIIEFSVKDNGAGISSDEWQHIFKKFYKVRNDTFSGSGLGLAIAKSFVELHGGKIEIKSKVNLGTEIKCSFPRHNKDLLKKNSAKEVQLG